MNQSNLEPEIERLRRLDCCAVSDAMDRLKLQGVITGVPQQSGDGRIAGRAITVQLISAQVSVQEGTGDPPPGPPRHLGTTAIDLGNENNVIVIEQRTGIDAGCWGGLLTLGAMQRHIQGVVADGPVRDIDEARGHHFPIFAQKTTAFTARGRVVEKATNVPITIWDVAVNPGDYILADRSAVIVIGPDVIESVLETAESIVVREAAMAKALLAGRPASSVMGGDYEDMLK